MLHALPVCAACGITPFLIISLVVIFIPAMPALTVHASGYLHLLLKQEREHNRFNQLNPLNDSMAIEGSCLQNSGQPS